MIAGLHIRSMQPGDLDSVLSIAAQLHHAPQWPRSAYEAALAPHARPARLCLVASLPESPIAAFLVASVVPPQAEIESIVVAPQVQRQGLGRALLAAAIAELRKRAVSETFLEVRASNMAALALYQSAGFVLTGRRPGYYSQPTEDALLFRSSLVRLWKEQQSD